MKTLKACVRWIVDLGFLVGVLWGYVAFFTWSYAKVSLAVAGVLYLLMALIRLSDEWKHRSSRAKPHQLLRVYGVTGPAWFFGLVLVCELTVQLHYGFTKDMREAMEQQVVVRSTDGSDQWAADTVRLMNLARFLYLVISLSLCFQFWSEIAEWRRAGGSSRPKLERDGHAETNRGDLSGPAPTARSPATP